jgi:hypothetical protein
MDVVTLVIGISVASTRTGPDGFDCQTTITAATSAHSADSRRSLATITPLTFVPTLRGV